MREKRTFNENVTHSRYIIARLLSGCLCCSAADCKNVFRGFSLRAGYIINLWIFQHSLREKAVKRCHLIHRCTEEIHREWFSETNFVVCNQLTRLSSILCIVDGKRKAKVQTDLSLWHPITLFWFNKHRFSSWVEKLRYKAGATKIILKKFGKRFRENLVSIFFYSR